MNNTLLSVNEKIKKEMKKSDQSKSDTKQLIMSLLISLLFSLVFLTSSFKVGGTTNIGTLFIIPILGAIIQVNKRIGITTMLLITIGNLLFLDNLNFLATSVSFIYLIFIAQFNLSKNKNIMLVIASAITSYLILNIINQTVINLYFILFIILVDYVMSYIYFQVIDVHDFNKKKLQILFKEEIHAILLGILNLSIGLYLLRIVNVNIGFIFTLFSIMVIGLVSNKTYTMIYTFAAYFLLKYTGLTYQSVEVIPFIGLGAILFEKRKINLKTLYFLVIPAILDELMIIRGDLIAIYISVLIASIAYFIVAPYITKNYSHLLIPKYEEAKYYKSYVQNFREEISNRLLHFSELFDQFGKKSSETNEELTRLDEAIDQVINRHCKKCIKKDLCLKKNHIKTYNYFTELLREGDHVYVKERRRFLDLFGMFCLNAYELVQSTIQLNKEYKLTLKRKEGDNQYRFQSQLSGVAKILQQYAIEVNNDFEDDDIKIERIKDQLRKMGIATIYVRKESLKCSRVDLELGVRELSKVDVEKILIPTLQGLLKEEIELMSYKENKGFTKVRLISKQMYEIDFGTSYIGKGGSRICGDNFLKCELHNGNTVIALSDGMGCGYAAHMESKSTLELLNQMLKTGADDYTAVSTINTLISLKEYNERFSTLDYITINKSVGSIDFYKIGSAPSFIIRGNKIIQINNENLPMGEVDEIESIGFELKVNDVILIMSDGVNDRYKNPKRFEKALLQIPKNSATQIAHDIIRASITEYGGKIPDDMTAIVLKVKPRNKKPA